MPPLTCDRCGGDTDHRRAIVHRPGHDDEEVICPDCSTVDDRII